MYTHTHTYIYYFKSFPLISYYTIEYGLLCDAVGLSTKNFFKTLNRMSCIYVK